MPSFEIRPETLPTTLLLRRKDETSEQNTLSLREHWEALIPPPIEEQVSQLFSEECPQVLSQEDLSTLSVYSEIEYFDNELGDMVVDGRE